jgi:hypothetical protein
MTRQRFQLREPHDAFVSQEARARDYILIAEGQRR